MLTQTAVITNLTKLWVSQFDATLSHSHKCPVQSNAFQIIIIAIRTLEYTARVRSYCEAGSPRCREQTCK